MRTSIIVPTYNERDNLVTLINGLESLSSTTNIFIIDDNSPDGTAVLAQELASTRPWLKVLTRAVKDGQGSAYKMALTNESIVGQAEAVVTMDADGSHPPSKVADLVKALSDYDLVIGSRYVEGGKTVGWSRRRQVLSQTANWLTRNLLGLKIADATSGFVAMRSSLVQQIVWDKIDAGGYAFHVELKHYAVKKLGARVKELPIVFADRARGESKISGAIMLEWLLIVGRLLGRRIRGY